MNIIVPIKQVPDTADVRLDPKTGHLIREGVGAAINPDDLNALEAALRIRESEGASHVQVTVLSMGPAQAIDALSQAMGMGADRGVLLCDGAFAGADTWATSFTLGRAIEQMGDVDLILCGRQAIDGDTAQVGPQLAEFLHLPQVTYVFDIESIAADHLVVKRRLENGYERIRCRMPALITVIGEINTPRYSHMGRLLMACREKAPITVWNAADIGVTTAEVGLNGSLTHVIRTFAPKCERHGEILEGDTDDKVEGLVARLKENRLV